MTSFKTMMYANKWRKRSNINYVFFK